MVAIDEREDVIKRFSSHFIPFPSLIPMGFRLFPFRFLFSNLKNNGFSYCKVSKVESEGEKGGMVQIQGPTDGIDGIQYHWCPHFNRSGRFKTFSSHSFFFSRF